MHGPVTEAITASHAPPKRIGGFFCFQTIPKVSLMRAATTPPHLHTLILLTAFSPVTLNMFPPSLANIADDLQTDYAVVSLAIAGYLAVTAVIQLIAGPLSDRFGRRPVLLSALSVFTLASMGCALADDIWTFLAFRMLQGSMLPATPSRSLSSGTRRKNERQLA